MGASTRLIALLLANVGSRNCTFRSSLWAVPKDLNAYSVAAWMGLYGQMYTWYYRSTHGRDESCKRLTSTAYKINYSPFTRDHSSVRGRYARYKRVSFITGRVGVCIFTLGLLHDILLYALCTHKGRRGKACPGQYHHAPMP